MTIEELRDRLTAMIESKLVSGDTEVIIDVPDESGYYEDDFTVYGLSTFINGSFHLKIHKKER